MDPWTAGGVRENSTDNWGSIALMIEGAAHHLDLRLPDDLDPPTVKEARIIERNWIKKWLDEYNAA